MLYQCIDNRNTYYEMFTLEPDSSPVGLTNHCKLVLDQINFMIGRGQKGIFFSYDAFCKSSLLIVDHVQTLYDKYDVHCYDIGEGEVEVTYDLIVIFGDFEGIGRDIPQLWRAYIIPKLTPVVFYTTRSYRGFEQVEFDEIVARIRPEVSGELALKSSDAPSSSDVVPVGSQNLSILDIHEPPKREIQDTANKAVPQQYPTATEKKLEETSQNDLALRRKIKNLQGVGMSIRKIAEELGITKGKVEWLLKRKPAQLNKTRPKNRKREGSVQRD